MMSLMMDSLRMQATFWAYIDLEAQHKDAQQSVASTPAVTPRFLQLEGRTRQVLYYTISHDLFLTSFCSSCFHLRDTRQFRGYCSNSRRRMAPSPWIWHICSSPSQAGFDRLLNGKCCLLPKRRRPLGQKDDGYQADLSSGL